MRKNRGARLIGVGGSSIGNLKLQKLGKSALRCSNLNDFFRLVKKIGVGGRFLYEVKR